MSKFLKRAGVVVAGLLIVVAVLAIVVIAVSDKKLTRPHAVRVSMIPIPTGAAAIERGRHIAASRGCIDCHGADLGGAKVIDDGAMGRVYGPNITPAGTTKTFTDEDWIRAIRHGVARDGHALLVMPAEEYASFSDDDLGAVIAYAKSIPPVDRPSVPLKVGPVARVLVATGKLELGADMIERQPVKPSTVAPGLTVEYGRYLANGCIGCHNPSYSGGKIAVGPPDWPAAANLTTHEAGALRGWTEADFVAALRAGKRPNGTEINPVMPRAFGNMSDDELKALWLFLRTVPPRATGAR